MAKGVLHDGLSNRSPSFEDSSTKLPTKTSVNSDAVRKSPAPTPKTLGPRSA